VMRLRHAAEAGRRRNHQSPSRQQPSQGLRTYELLRGAVVVRGVKGINAARCESTKVLHRLAATCAVAAGVAPAFGMILLWCPCPGCRTSEAREPEKRISAQSECKAVLLKDVEERRLQGSPVAAAQLPAAFDDLITDMPHTAEL